MVTVASFSLPEPEPLTREAAPAADYPVDALGPIAEAARAVQDLSQAPIAIAAQSALSAASLAVQSFANVQTLGGFAPLSLYCLTIAKSGERKSYCDNLLLRGLRDYERERSAEYRNDVAEWQVSHLIWSKRRDKLARETTGKKGIEAEADLRNLGPEPEPPLVPNITATEPTLEGLHKLYQVGQPSLGLFTDEGGQFLGGHAMSQDNRLKTIAGLSSLWDGSRINRTRSGDGANTLFGRRLAAHIMVQPVAAGPLLADPLAAGQGFLARFLITQPVSAIGTRLKQGNNPQSQITLDRFGERLRALLGETKPLAEGSRQELQPRELPLSGVAHDRLWQYFMAIEREQAPGGDLCDLTSFASKSAEQAARIAGVLTLWADLNATQVTDGAMAHGIEIAQYHLVEAKRLTEAAEISEQVSKADGLRRWLLEKWTEKAAALDRSADHITPRDVAQHGPGALRETAKAKQALQLLEAHGWVQQLDPGVEVDGKARQIAYKIVSLDHVV